MKKAPILSYTVQANVDDEYSDNVPSHAVIELTPSLAKRILMLSRTCKKLKIWRISEFNYEPSWKVEVELSTEEGESGLEDWMEDKDNPGRMDAVTLDVTDQDFKWTGTIKHSSVEVDTEYICIGELKENMRVLQCKPEKLPLLIGKEFEYESSGKLVEKRMRGFKCQPH